MPRYRRAIRPAPHFRAGSAELLHDLAEERRRIDGLHTHLADARTAAMVSGSEAAALRAQAAERLTWRLLRRLRWAMRSGRLDLAP